jgi:tryptophanyl-tRNA synthetase
MRFHNKYGEIFTIPASTSEQVKFMKLDEALRIRDLLNPEKKMSKSTAAENSKIMLDDDPAKAAKKIMSATTDSLGKIKYDMFNQPGISNLLVIESQLSNVPLEDVIATWAGETRYGDLKQKVASSVSGFLSEFQSRLASISDGEVYELLAKGEAYANDVANKKLLEVQKAFKLR